MALVAALAGCAHFTGHSGTCKYGLGAGTSGNDCYPRPQPKEGVAAQAESSETLARALAAWQRSGGASRVTSVGIDHWAETTFTIGRGTDEHLTTFDVHGRRTSGDDGYVSSPHDTFPIRRVRPRDFSRLVRAVRAGQPGTQVSGAVVSVNPFQDVLTWRLTVTSPKTKAAILYEATPGGREICHARDYTPDDSLVPARGIPECANGSVLPFG